MPVLISDMPFESDFRAKSAPIQLKVWNVNLHIFWKNDTGTLIEELFRPEHLFFLENLSPSTVIKDCTFIRDIIVLPFFNVALVCVRGVRQIFSTRDDAKRVRENLFWTSRRQNVLRCKNLNLCKNFKLFFIRAFSCQNGQKMLVILPHYARIGGMKNWENLIL